MCGRSGAVRRIKICAISFVAKVNVQGVDPGEPKGLEVSLGILGRGAREFLDAGVLDLAGDNNAGWTGVVKVSGRTGGRVGATGIV